MKKIFTFYLFVLIFAFTAPAAAQDCTDPSGDIGVLRYNEDFGVLQVCTAQNWIGINPMACPDGDGCAAAPSAPTGCDTIGQQCDDLTYYIGDSPEDGAKVYMTDASHEGTGIRWDSASCNYCGNGSVATSQTDGRANTNALLAFNATGFDAIAHCQGLNATVAHGHTDWYLPAGGSSSGTEQDLFWTMVQAVGAVGGLGTVGYYYWSSTEQNSFDVRMQRFVIGSNKKRVENKVSTRSNTTRVRCIRR